MKYIYFSIIIFIFFSCGINSDLYNYKNSGGSGEINPIYRQYMRSFVEDISNYSKTKKSNFIVIPQNGNELITTDGEGNGSIDINYVSAIDGISREDLYYGYNNDNESTPAVDVSYMLSFLDNAKTKNLKVMVIDYCYTPSYIADSYQKSFNKGFISFAATHRELDNIPTGAGYPYNENTDNITNLSQAKNFLYIINPSSYASKTDFLNDIKNTNYDIVIVDLFYNGAQLSVTDVAGLKNKKNGAQRLVIAYMSIGEAENYRYYWNSSWTTNNPLWLDAENPDWPGNYKVRYWDPNWQKIILDGNNDSYLKRILDSGFSGVYLDLIDAFEYYE